MRGFACVIAPPQLNSETDFVARNAEFQAALDAIVDAALHCSVEEPANSAPGGLVSTTDAIAAAPSGSTTVKEAVVDLVGKIRENLVMRRATVLQAPAGGVVVPYIHNRVSAESDMGGIVAAVALSATPTPAAGSPQLDALVALGKVLAMQVAASRPIALDRHSVDATELERERAILTEQAQASGKPADIIARMVEGRLSKFYAEQCLMEQNCMVVEGDQKVKDLVKKCEKDTGAKVDVHGFRLLVVGDGVAAED
jgi:elongation factor Ts